MELFGFKITRKQDYEEEKTSFANKEEEDGAINVQAAGPSSGAVGQYLDLDNNVADEVELITKYRQLALQSEVEYAIDEIVNEAISSDQKEVVSLDLDNVKGMSSSMKKAFNQEFSNIVNMINFNKVAYEIFRRWIIDGRMYYHIIIDENNPGAGITELRYIDPRKIRKVREMKEVNENGKTLKKLANEYYVYSDRGFAKKSVGIENDFGSVTGLKISSDSIIHCTSGLMDENNKLVYSYLHKALRPMNMLRNLEDATVIYYISRAPERRVFYVDVGNLPKAKAEQYLKQVMNNFKNKLSYNSKTGDIKNQSHQMNMLEDFYLARRGGSKGTEISNIGGGQQLSQLMEPVEYYLKKLYKALNIPASRLEEGSGFSIGRTSEISRDEIKFNKFISRLRLRFSSIFLQSLETQLILKNIITFEEWNNIKNDVYFNFSMDNHFAEMKETDIMMSRLDVLERMDPYINRIFPEEWIKKEVLKLTDEQIEAMNKQSKDSSEDNPDSEENPPEEVSNT